MGQFLTLMLQSLVVTAWLVVLGRVLMSWIDPRFEKPVGQFLYSLTEPFLAPIRRILPQTGMFDFSPLVLLIGLGLLMRMFLYL
ncbi:MAG TPA: YggT family protein [Anaerolineae bacterium]|jgi:YggT family protein|nr:YggT family protein [Anaerolineae bacterium]